MTRSETDIACVLQPELSYEHSLTSDAAKAVLCFHILAPYPSSHAMRNKCARFHFRNSPLNVVAGRSIALQAGILRRNMASGEGPLEGETQRRSDDSFQSSAAATSGGQQTQTNESIPPSNGQHLHQEGNVQNLHGQAGIPAESPADVVAHAPIIPPGTMLEAVIRVNPFLQQKKPVSSLKPARGPVPGPPVPSSPMHTTGHPPHASSYPSESSGEMNVKLEPNQFRYGAPSSVAEPPTGLLGSPPPAVPHGHPGSLLGSPARNSGGFSDSGLSPTKGPPLSGGITTEGGGAPSVAGKVDPRSGLLGSAPPTNPMASDGERPDPRSGLLGSAPPTNPMGSGGERSDPRSGLLGSAPPRPDQAPSSLLGVPVTASEDPRYSGSASAIAQEESDEPSPKRARVDAMSSSAAGGSSAAPVGNEGAEEDEEEWTGILSAPGITSFRVHIAEMYSRSERTTGRAAWCVITSSLPHSSLVVARQDFPSC